MAGMFYSLKEAAEKLGITAEKIEELVKEGRLREFSDGPNVLYKVDEVEALMSDTGILWRFWVFFEFWWYLIQ